MPETSQRPVSVVATGSWVWRVLGILLGTATCISLVKNGFAIELYGLPLKIYQQYAWLRDMLFEPVVWVLRHFELTMPWWLKDVVLVYGLVAGAYLRASRAYWWLERLPWDRTMDALYWPVTQYGMWRYRRGVHHGAQVTGADFDRAVQRASRLLLLNLLMIVVSAAAFFLWNHLQNVFGPGG